MWDLAVLKGRDMTAHNIKVVVADDTPPPFILHTVVGMFICESWLTVTFPPLTGYSEVTADLHLLSTEYLCFSLSACISNVSPRSALSPIFFCVLRSYFCRYCITNALRSLLMHFKCHNVTDPVTQNDYLVPVSNALSSIYSLWDVALMFMRVSEQTNIIWNQGPVLAPHVTSVARVIERLEIGGWRLWTD